MMGEAPAAGVRSSDRSAEVFEPLRSSRGDGRIEGPPCDDASFDDPGGGPRFGPAATEVAGTARALCLDVVDLVAARMRARVEAMLGLALAGLLLLIAWLASMVALALWLTRWWPLEGAVLGVAALHGVLGVGIVIGMTTTGPSARSARSEGAPTDARSAG